MEEVQSYFEKRLEKIVESKGKNSWVGMRSSRVDLPPVLP
jgi:hypothetical protein